VHNTVLSVLDLAFHYVDILAASPSEASMPGLNTPSRSTISRVKFKKQRQRRKSAPVRLSDTEESSAPGSDLDTYDPTEPDQNDTMVGQTISFVQESLEVQVEKIALQLDAHMLSVRGDVERLASGTPSENAGVFGICAFVMEDWDV
jgi:hypothetical protein